MRRSFWLLLIGLFCLGWGQASVSAGERDKRLDIYWIDVEGGAATLIVTPAGESILVDCGNPGPRDAGRVFDVAAKLAGLRRIDHLIVTHYHRDHFGGAATLAGLIPISRLYDNGEFPGGKERPDQDYLDFKVGERLVLRPGQELELRQAKGEGLPPCSLTCLGCRQEFIDAPPQARKIEQVESRFRPKDRDDSDNANSVVLLAKLGKFRFFDAGDLTWNVEQKLISPTDLVGEVDVYQVTHHGLDVSNNSLLVGALAPTVAIMNNGVTKGCQPETFATLKETKSIEAVYQMHRNLRPDGDVNNVAAEYIANAEENCQANYIHLSVASDGASYSVSIPANRHERTFEVK